MILAASAVFGVGPLQLESACGVTNPYTSLKERGCEKDWVRLGSRYRRLWIDLFFGSRSSF